MSSLNKIENAIMQSIVEENKNDYPFLAKHFKYLKVSRRNFTGVGAYTYFCYLKEFEKSDVNELISSNKRLFIEGFQNELSFVLYIINGKIKFLEIVTNGNDIFKDKNYNFKLI